jgi:hypothetical protein
MATSFGNIITIAIQSVIKFSLGAIFWLKGFWYVHLFLYELCSFRKEQGRVAPFVSFFRRVLEYDKRVIILVWLG